MDAERGLVSPSAAAPASAATFHGNWREFAPIAFTNLLLSIVTLGIYRFWAVTRERHYLWSRTRLIDEPLEWTGTGRELFTGFVMVIVIMGLPYLVITLIGQRAILQNQPVVGGIITLLLAGSIFYFVGVARFRALRYRLSRTSWYGIRGGSEDPGFGYGWSYIWKSFVGAIVMGLLIPWSMCSLWDERWGKMSFGPHQFRSNTDFAKLMPRFLLFYAVPVLMLVGGIGFGIYILVSGFAGAPPPPELLLPLMAVLLIGFYVGLPLVWLFYYSAFYRMAVDSLSLHMLEFGFTARSRDWLVLILVDIVLVVGTLGIGSIFIGYRHWKFFVTHVEVYGEIDLDGLTQSTTARAGHGEGLLDALDIGAF